MNKIENLRKWKMLEETRSKVYLDAFCEFEDKDSKFASKLYNLHVLHYNNALECNELLVEIGKWLKKCDQVINKIECGDD